MKKWELARYLIDAKKCVDSILYISEHVKDLSNLNLREVVQDKLSKYYINLRTVYCDSFSSKERKEMIKNDTVFERTMYEADKNYAHKDPEYDYKEIESFNSLIESLKEKINHCRELCKCTLPDVLTLDFVEHDPVLFRLLNKIDKAEEERLMKLKHPAYGKNPAKDVVGKTMKVFSDTEQIKTVEDPYQYASIISVGLTERETIQTLQDGFIRTNVLAGTDIWPHSDMEKHKEMRKFLEEIGLGYLY